MIPPLDGPGSIPARCRSIQTTGPDLLDDVPCAEEGVGAPGDELIDHRVVDYESDIG